MSQRTEHKCDACGKIEYTPGKMVEPETWVSGGLYSIGLGRGALWDAVASTLQKTWNACSPICAAALLRRQAQQLDPVTHD